MSPGLMGRLLPAPAAVSDLPEPKYFYLGLIGSLTRARPKWYSVCSEEILAEPQEKSARVKLDGIICRSVQSPGNLVIGIHNFASF